MLYADIYHCCIVFRSGKSVLASDQRSHRSGKTIAMLVILLKLHTVSNRSGNSSQINQIQFFFRLRGWVPFAEVADEYNEIHEVLETKRLEAEALKKLPVYKRIEPFTNRGFIAPFLLVSATFFAGHFSGQTTLQTYAVDVRTKFVELFFCFRKNY